MNQSQATPSIPHTIQELSTSLQALAPNPNETTKLINYALIATALMGIFVYHYIKSQEAQEPC